MRRDVQYRQVLFARPIRMISIIGFKTLTCSFVSLLKTTVFGHHCNPITSFCFSTSRFGGGNGWFDVYLASSAYIPCIGLCFGKGFLEARRVGESVFLCVSVGVEVRDVRDGEVEESI